MFRNCFLVAATLLAMIVSRPGLAQPSSEADARSLLSAFVSYTDLRMSSVQQSLEILASTSEAKSAKWQKMKPLLSRYEKSDGDLIVWFVRPDGGYYTVDRGFMDVKLSDRNYFPRLISGQHVMGELVVSKSTGLRSAVIAVPVKQGGKVIGAIGASLFLDKLSDELASVLAPGAGASFFSLAPSGLTTLHRRTERHFMDPRELGSESLKKAADEMLANPEGETSYEFDDGAKKAVYRTSPLTHWKFAITYSEARQK